MHHGISSIVHLLCSYAFFIYFQFEAIDLVFESCHCSVYAMYFLVVLVNVLT